MVAKGPKNCKCGLERCLPLGFWRSRQLLLNKFFDPSTPSMRKVDSGGKKRGKRGVGVEMAFIVATNVVKDWISLSLTGH